MNKLIDWNDKRVTEEKERYTKLSDMKLKLLADVMSVMKADGFREFRPNWNFLDTVNTEFNDPENTGYDFEYPETPFAYFMRKESDKVVVALISTDFDTQMWYTVNIVTVSPDETIERS